MRLQQPCTGAADTWKVSTRASSLGRSTKLSIGKMAKNSGSEGDVASLEANGILALESLDELKTRLGQLDSKKQDQTRPILLESLRRNLDVASDVDLLLVIIERLGFRELLELCNATMSTGRGQVLEQKQRVELALFYTSSYLNIPRTSRLDLRSHIQRLASHEKSSSHEQSLFDIDQALELAFDCSQWALAFELVDTYFGPFESLSLLNRRRIHCKRGHSYESCDNYQRALVSFDEAGCLEKHAIRLIIKNNVGFAERQLKNQIDKFEREDISQMWLECSFACGHHSNDQSLPESLKDMDEKTFDHLLKLTPETIEQQTFNLLPDRIRVFLTNNDAAKWQDRHLVMSISELGSNLSDKMRRCLAKIVSRPQAESGPTDSQKVCSIYKILDEPELLFETMSTKATVSNENYLRLLNNFASQDQLATSLSNLMLNDSLSNTNQARNLKEDQLQSVIYLKLGLLDETLQVSLRLIRGEQDISPLVAHIESLARDDKPATELSSQLQPDLDELDPELCPETLKGARKVLESIQMSGQQQLAATNVIVYVISCQVIFLRKLDPTLTDPEASEQIQQGGSLSLLAKLELMFEHLAGLLQQFDFAVSDGLLRITNELVKVVKFKLELLADCDCIRNTLGQLVESSASKCLMAAKYKQAAILYSHIDDNISAAKALMRTGDLEVVTNFALLVNDIAVNRITINYLRHLGAAETIQQEFISKTSSSQAQKSEY